MNSNYPPGVTGNEPQIVGDEAWEDLCDWIAETGLESGEIKEAVNNYSQERAHADALAGALGEAREAIASLDIDALGVVPEKHDCPAYPIRDELIDAISKPLTAYRKYKEPGE